MRQPPETDDLRANALYCAGECLDAAVAWLRTARAHYEDKSRPMPMPLRRARLAALDAKIAALRDVVDPAAHPWKGDFS